VRKAEAGQQQIVMTTEKRMQQYVSSLNRLDNQLNGVPQAGDDNQEGGSSYMALRIGERLEELERQRQRAQDAKNLLLCWLEVSERGSLSSLEQLKRKQGGDGKVKSAALARQLLMISQKLEQDDTGQVNGNGPVNGTKAVNGIRGSTTSHIERNSQAPRNSQPVTSAEQTKRRETRELIEKFLEGLETDLLQQFDAHYRRQNFEGMKECAAALRDFNDGASVTALFVNQHNFFIDRNQLLNEEIGDGETWERIADPDDEPPGVEPGLQAVIDDVKVTVVQESWIIKRAFPVPEEVLATFLQRVFQQSVQQRLEMVLQKAGSISSLSFLRALQSSRSYIQTLVDDLKAHGLIEHPEPASPAVTASLDSQLEELFVPYLSGSSYIEREKRNLDELYSSLLFKFTTYHSRRKKTPTTYLDRLGQRSAQLIQSAREGIIDRLDSSEIPVAQKAVLLRIAGVKDSNKDKKDIEVTEEDGQLSVDHAKRMIKWLAEGVGRSLELNGGNETPRDIQALLGVLLTQMGEIYLDSALTAASDAISGLQDGAAAKVEPDLSYLPNLRGSVRVLHLLQTTVSTMLLPLTHANVTIRREVEKRSTATLGGLEGKISGILHRTLDVVMAWTAKLLVSQKKTDFRPRDEDMAAAIEALQTPTALSIYTFLAKTADLAKQTLDGANLSGFLGELAVGLRTHLLEHFKRFSVSLTGGLVVSKDVTKYSELVRGWPLQGTQFERTGGMEVLAEVANLFVIGPEALRERLKGGASQGRSREEIGELKKYVEKREDSGSVGVQAVLSGL
jgi:hypothetical protein